MMEAKAIAEANSFSAAYEKFEDLVVQLKSKEAWEMTHSELESLIWRDGFEVLRLLLQAHLDLRAEVEPRSEPEGADGMVRTHVRGTERGLMSLFGPVQVRRLGYSRRAGSVLHPLDGELNIAPEFYSHGVSRRVAEEGAKNSFDDVVESIRRGSGASVPKRQAEELVVRAATDFDRFYARRAAAGSQSEPTGSVLVISTDGKGVMVRHADLREATRQAAERKSAKMSKRLSKGEKRYRKRMAQVASVYTIERVERQPEDIVAELEGLQDQRLKRPKPEQKRVWASLEKEPEQVIEAAFREAMHRDPNREKQWVALVDGNKTQLNLLQKLAQQYQVRLVIGLDIIHVLEYLWKAAYAFQAEGTEEAQEWVKQRLVEILKGRSSYVAAGLRRSATRRHLTGKKRKAVDTCADYLLTYGKYLRYDQYLGAGFPIATGVVEGACRHLVKDRMEKTGARWSLKVAEAVLQIRSLRASQDLDEYWQFHEEQELKRNHERLYADGKVPNVKPADTTHGETPHLRLVK